MRREAQAGAGGAGHRKRDVTRVLLLVLGAAAVAAALVLLGRAGVDHIAAFVRWVEGSGRTGPLLFVVGYAAATVAFVPGSLLTLAAGAVFGIARGVAFVFAGALLGSTAAFVIARYVARGAVERRVGRDPRFEALDRRVGREGLKLVLLLRLTPVMPYNLLNYALGLTAIRLRHYVIGSLGMLPGTLLYVYSGRVAGDVAAVLAGRGVERGVGYWMLLGAGLAATVLLTVWVTRMARDALRAEAPGVEGSGGARETGSPGRGGGTAGAGGGGGTGAGGRSEAGSRGHGGDG